MAWLAKSSNIKPNHFHFDLPKIHSKIILMRQIRKLTHNTLSFSMLPQGTQCEARFRQKTHARWMGLPIQIELGHTRFRRSSDLRKKNPIVWAWSWWWVSRFSFLWFHLSVRRGSGKGNCWIHHQSNTYNSFEAKCFFAEKNYWGKIGQIKIEISPLQIHQQ